MTNVFRSIGRSAMVVLVSGLLLASCRETTAPVPDVAVVVDSAVYHLRPTVGPWYEITLTATISNQGAGAIHLHQDCPSFSTRRPPNHVGSLWLGQVACFASAARAFTITLGPAESHTQTFKLSGSVQNQSNPPITMDDLTGSVVFGFLVSTDMKSFSAAYSAPFVVKPPS